MSIDILVMFAGFMVAVLPFLGFPIQWDNVILVILGVFVIALGIFIRRRSAQRERASQASSFVDSTPNHVEGQGH